MRPVSDAYLAAARSSHTSRVRGWLLDTFQTGVSPVGVELQIVGGSVRAAAGAQIRSTCDVTVLADWPITAGDLLTPYGPEISLQRGIVLGSTTEWVSLGFFRVESIREVATTDSARRGPPTLRLTGSDRMSQMRDERFPTPRQYVSTTVGDVIEDLVLEVYPDATIEYDDGTDTSGIGLSRSPVAERERVDFLRELVTSHGRIAYWDHRGVFVVKAQPSIGDPVPWVLSTGRDGVLVEKLRDINRDGVYNGVVVTGEGPDTQVPVVAIVTDDNPRSATRWGGRFGRVPTFFTSTMIRTVDQATATGVMLLDRRTGHPYAVEMTNLANMALEPYDTVMIRDSREKVFHMLDELSYPLVGATMSVGSRGTLRADTR